MHGLVACKSKDAAASLASARVKAVAAELERLGVAPANIKASGAKKASGSLVKLSGKL